MLLTFVSVVLCGCLSSVAVGFCTFKNKLNRSHECGILTHNGFEVERSLNMHHSRVYSTHTNVVVVW